MAKEPKNLTPISEPTILEFHPATLIIPPRRFLRNEFGLIDDGSVTYIYNEDGTINWRKMVKPDHLVPNKQVFDRRNKPTPKEIDGLHDNELLILLAGIKELAFFRGYSSVTYQVVAPTPNYVVATCQIEWMPNFETGGRPITFSAIGDACPENTTSFGRVYLGAMAENRAFVRSVRNFLKINIVSQEEMGPAGGKEFGETDNTSVLLKETMDKYGVPFETIKKKLIAEGVEGVEAFTSLDEIPKIKKFELIERIKTKAAAREAKP
jgi:hypothetical protein